jgi:hypothetical protein
VGEDHGTHAIAAQHPPAFGEGAGHGIFVEGLVLGPTVLGCGTLVLHRLARLWHKLVRGIERIAQQRMARQRPLEPDKEKVRQVGIGHRIIVGRVGEPDRGRVVGQRVLCGVGELDLARSGGETHTLGAIVRILHADNEAATGLSRGDSFGEVPSDR